MLELVAIAMLASWACWLVSVVRDEVRERREHEYRMRKGSPDAD